VPCRRSLPSATLPAVAALDIASVEQAVNYTYAAAGKLTARVHPTDGRPPSADPRIAQNWAGGARHSRSLESWQRGGTFASVLDWAATGLNWSFKSSRVVQHPSLGLGA